MQKVRFAYNPKAGETVITDWLDNIIDIYQRGGYSIMPYRLAFTETEETDLLDDIDGSYHHILVAGGDGTVNYVVNMLKRRNLDLPVAVLPTGTANDFANTLGVPSDIEKACRRILGGEIRRVDLGRANDEYFVNVFSCGLFTDVSQKTPTILKNTFGKLAYYFGGLGELPNFRKMHISIESDGGNYEGPSLIFFVFNGRTAGQMRFAYLSEIDDGLLDVIVIKGDRPIETVRTIFHFIKRNTKDYPAGIVHFKSRDILLHSYKSAAKECTASLLRAKPPKNGKRILLERITWLWSRFSFNTKMVVRNLMRNKLRTVMMLVGLLCCTMLIITSLGLQDSVTSLSVKYYTKSLDYDVIANLTGTVDKAESYERRADADAAECLMEKSVSLRTDAGTRTERLTVLEDDQTMIHLGENETFVRLQTGTAAVTYKLTKTLNLHVGDVVRVYLPGDSDPFDIAIGQIVYNNVTQGIYLNRTTWESLRKGEFVPTGLMLKNPDETYPAQLADMDEVDSLDYPAKLIDDMMQMLDSLSAVFTMLTCIALALAFVICYNMGLMNFVERTREYATLKVLGYHQREIRRLMLRENNYISIIGVLLGIPPGFLITTIILKMCEYDSMVFPTHVTFPSVAGACAITYVFAFLIQLLLTRKVRSIDMVEALKSVE